MTQFKLSQPINNFKKQNFFRRVNNENLSRLSTSLQSVDWSCIYESDDVDSSYDMFYNILHDKLDSNMPPKKEQPKNYKKSPRLPWISKAVLRSINRKNDLYYKYKLEKTDQSKKKYRSYKNILTNIIRVEKKNYFVTRLELCKNDMKNTWKIIKEAMNLNNDKSKIDKIKSNDVIIEDPTNIADIFNTYFSSIGDNLSSNIPLPQKKFVDFLGPSNAKSMFLLPTHRQEILKIVKDFPNKRSSGHDDINYVITKGIIHSIVDPLVHLLNLSLLHGRVPNSMKIAKVIPLFKQGDKLDVCNYRPISLLSSFSKILEKIVYNRMLSFLKRYNILSNLQFGFREKHSTVHALLSFVEKTAYSIDKSMHMIGIFLDFSKAFDTINHEILLYKLSRYGVRGKALEWFRSYLSGRTQYVSLDNQSSNLCNINCGVPQGSLLGPLLFLLYINDFCRSSDILSFIHFADDTNIFFSHDDPQTLAEIVNYELVNILQWIRSNKLSLNLQKTKYMLFSKSLETLPINIMFDDTPLEQVSSTKFLGIVVDDKLSWKPHVDKICKLISRNIGIINRLKTQLPLNSLLMLYTSLISPYLHYGLLVWGNANQTLLDRILLLQKKALRIIHNSPARAHTDPIFIENKLLKIRDLYTYQLGQLLFNYNKNSLPHIFNDMFKKNDSIHSYPTRHSCEFHLPLLRTLSAQHTFIYEGPKFWNSLNNDIKTAPSLPSFKRRLKSHLLQSYQ